MTDQPLTKEQKAEAKRLDREAKAKAKAEALAKMTPEQRLAAQDAAQQEAQRKQRERVAAQEAEKEALVVASSQPVGITMAERNAKREAEKAEMTRGWKTLPMDDITRTLWEKEGNVHILEATGMGTYRINLLVRAK